MFSHKIKKFPRVCKLNLYYSARVRQSIGLETTDQAFYSNRIINANFDNVYFGHGSFEFNEKGSDSDPGQSYTQQINLQFNSNDNKRAKRISQLTKVVAIEIILNDGRSMLLGKNDVQINAKPSVSTSSNLGRTIVTYTTWSEHPASFIAKGIGSSGPFYGGNFGEATFI